MSKHRQIGIDINTAHNAREDAEVRICVALMLKCCLLTSACSIDNPVLANDECDYFKFMGGEIYGVRSDAVKELDTRTSWFETGFTVASMEIHVPDLDQLDSAKGLQVLRLESLTEQVEGGKISCINLPRPGEYVYCSFNLPNVPLLLSGEFQSHDDFDAAATMQALAERVKTTVLNCPSNELEQLVNDH